MAGRRLPAFSTTRPIEIRPSTGGVIANPFNMFSFLSPRMAAYSRRSGLRLLVDDKPSRALFQACVSSVDVWPFPGEAFYVQARAASGTLPGDPADREQRLR